MKPLLLPANFSSCRRYRYTLARDLDPTGELRGTVAWCGLNPSTADEYRSDPTCTREMNFTRAWGYRRYVKVNIFGWRDTDPKGMKDAADPVGPENNRWIAAAARHADIFVLAWGTHGVHLGRDLAVLRLIERYAPKVRYLKLTAAGQPSHPLYLRADLPASEWSWT